MAGNPTLHPYGIPEDHNANVTYAVVAAPDPVSLCQAIAQHVQDGYLPIGGIACNGSWDPRIVEKNPAPKFFQAIIRILDGGPVSEKGDA